MRRKRFGVGGGIGPNMPTIRIYPGDKVFTYRLTWIGAYFGACWRNLLGPLYFPISPEKRWDLDFAKTLEERARLQEEIHDHRT